MDKEIQRIKFNIIGAKLDPRTGKGGNTDMSVVVDTTFHPRTEGLASAGITERAGVCIMPSDVFSSRSEEIWVDLEELKKVIDYADSVVATRKMEVAA